MIISLILSFVIQTFPILIVHVTNNNQECEESVSKRREKMTRKLQIIKKKLSKDIEIPNNLKQT